MECWSGFFGGDAMEILAYLGKMLNSSAMFLEILCTSGAKEPCRTGSFVWTEACIFDLFSKVVVRAQWIRSIRKAGTLGCYQGGSEPRNDILRAKDPDAIRSNPRAMAHSAAPYFTRLLDW